MANDQEMSGWTDLLHSSTKLLEQATPSSQFPPLQVLLLTTTLFDFDSPFVCRKYSLLVSLDCRTGLCAFSPITMGLIRNDVSVWFIEEFGSIGSIVEETQG